MTIGAEFGKAPDPVESTNQRLHGAGAGTGDFAVQVIGDLVQVGQSARGPANA